MAARRILAEGWIEEGHHGAVSLPDVAYVQQGNRVWFAEGRQHQLAKQLLESVGAPAIVESYEDLDLVERTLPSGATTRLPKDGRWFVEGIGQRSNTENANRRKYSKKIWERIIANTKSSQQEAIKARAMVGHFEHPADGRTDGKQIALVTVSAKLQEDGGVWARHELLDTPSGLILQELTRKQVRWGVSTRGSGSIDDKGNVSESDYEMECWDAVMKPSTPGAYPAAAKVETVQEDTTVQDIAAMDAITEGEDDIALTRKLMGMIGKVAEAPSDQQRSALACWLKKKLNEATDRLAIVLEDAHVTRSVESASETGQEAALVIRQLQERLEKLARDAEHCRSTLAEAHSTIASLTEERDTAYAIVEQAEADCMGLTRKTEAQRSLILARKTEPYPAAAVVEAIIAVRADLSPYRAILLESTGLPHLRESVDAILDVIRPADRPVVRIDETEAPKPRIARLANIVSESDVTAKVVNLHPMAAAAAGAMRRLGH